MLDINKDLYQFSTYNPHINLSFHQYLLMTNEPILFHTGNAEQAKELLPKLNSALNGKELKYIYVSHFEADECGGLSVILEQYPNALTICSEVTARQINGFGMKTALIIKKPKEKMIGDDFELTFYKYPSEMHLWDGLLVMEEKRSIFFSSDLMIRLGEEIGTKIESNWDVEINNITQDQVPDTKKLELLQKTLREIKPRFIATGHGPCLNV